MRSIMLRSVLFLVLVMVPVSALAEAVTEEAAMKQVQEIFERSMIEDRVGFGYEAMDLDANGTPEVLVTGNVMYCGSGGCSYWLFRLEDGRWTEIGEFFGYFNTALAVMDGMPPLVFLARAGASYAGIHIWGYDGRRYEEAACVTNAFVPEKGWVSQACE